MIFLPLYIWGNGIGTLTSITATNTQNGALGKFKTAEKVYVNIETKVLKKDALINVVLPDNTIVSFENKNFETRGNDDLMWSGQGADGEKDTFSLFTTKNGVTYGVIRHEGKRYVLQKFDGEEYSIRFEPEPKREGIDYKVPPIQKAIEFSPEGALQDDATKHKVAPISESEALGEGTSYVDTMVLYTQAYANYYGASLDAVIQLSIDYANDALNNSLIDMAYRLDYQGLYDNVSSNENATINTSLDYITNDDTIKQLRAQEGSDLVTLFRLNTSGGTVGLGWIAPDTSRQSMRRYSFNVSEFSELTFAHEAGHNLGCAHDHVQGCNYALFNYSCGYINGTFGTIMSYTNNYIQYFSNPDPTLTVGGLPIGVPEGDPATAADCARTISQTKIIMAMNDTVAEENEAGDAINGLTMTGTINGIDNDSYVLNLGGSTQISLASQYASPSYFANLYKNGNYLVTSFNTSSETLSLDNGEYILVLSLTNADTGSYYPDGGNRDYSVDITTEYIAEASNNSINPGILYYLLN